MSIKMIAGSLAAFRLVKRYRKIIFCFILAVIISMVISLIIGKIYQHWDNDPERGAMPIENALFGESYSTPVYLDQGWDEADSLWFYNTTQGSGMLPYDFFMVLEQAGATALLRDPNNMDAFRYLPQKPTFFNPDGLPVGFVKDTYQGRDYIGYTCAACHTSQVNYQGKAIRIDGGPAMADMVSFLVALEKSLKAVTAPGEKRERFIQRVLELDNNYDDKKAVEADIEKWTYNIELYNTINHSHIDYGFARLDAFGRIYNRVLQHVLSKKQMRDVLLDVVSATNQPLLTTEQVDLVLKDINNTIIGDEEFALISERLESDSTGYPNLSPRQMLRVRNSIFNEPNAPVSYPFLWDIAHSDYVQWNGLAGNSGVGPLGRNAGEVIGVFGILDWTAKKPGFSLSAHLTGQSKKQERIDFKSSIDLVNLERLESHLKSLQSPVWPEQILGEIDKEKANRGRVIYSHYCQSCHEIIDRSAWDRVVIGKMSNVDAIGTDPVMARNSVDYKGKSGNFVHTYQGTDVGPLVLEENAPVIQILTSVTTGVVSTEDADKWALRRGLDWLYTLAMSFFDNDIKSSMKAGNYKPDTTANPYDSLLSYKARSLNGIWATAPYLHNGSVPTMYDLLLPRKEAGDPEDGQYRPDEFMVGSREYDPIKMGFRSEGYEGFRLRTFRASNMNGGHEYGAGPITQADGTVLPALTEQQRWDLIEFIKTL